MMSVARVTEITATSERSFEEAIQHAVDRASDSLRNVKAAWVKEQEVAVVDGKISEYKVNLKVTFILDK
jgi:dodecin